MEKLNRRANVPGRFYPDATAFDPPQEFAVSYPHLFVVGPMLGLVGLAYGLERRRVRGMKGRGRKEA